MKRKISVFLMIVATFPAMAQSQGRMPVPLLDGKTKTLVSPAERSQIPGQAAVIDQRTVVQRYGTVIDQRLIGAGGLTAWTVEKNGRRVVLYTTSDGQAIISGVVWDSISGRNLSDQFATGMPSVPLAVANAVPPSPVPPSSVASAQPVGALVGTFTGSLPESIKTIDALAGVKEGKGGAADTLYVIYDPRCPYCRKAYSATREYVKRGFTIKWIPAMALGNPGQGIPLAASVLQARPSEQKDMLRRVLGEKEEIPAVPTKATQEALKRNLEFFFAAFKNNGVDQAGVPVAFFLDKRTGKPRMMTGVSELPVIEAVFGKL